MRDDMILLGHGSGGQMTHDLVNKVILPLIHEGREAPEQEDSTPLTLPTGEIRFTTDSYVVDPIIFPGGDIGDLAVNGTINDLAMGGAVPFALSLGFILEEGLLMDDFTKVLRSIGRAAREAGIQVACGDTKVVPRGRGDKIFINTSGVGLARNGLRPGSAAVRPGDRLIINGTVGDHGVTIMSMREGLKFESPVKSDTAALHTLVDALVKAGVEIRAMRDPTRGGLATVAVEIAEASGVHIRLDETAIPVNKHVAAACEILGLDPLMVANEGKMVLVTPERDAKKALDVMRSHPLGRDAAMIGEALETDGRAKVTLTSYAGGARMVNKLPGELLPRIC
ncbi:MAG: hydrogenase expression/formation protein HypE [Nitrospinae bacterium]|nr:hydrogenase expression/formation protein HypE [Nitrospinota bacterium]